MKKISIIGAGISGLFLANLLEREKSISYKIYEKRESIDFNDGYGIQLSVNSINLLNKIGFQKVNAKDVYFQKKVNFFVSKNSEKICDIDLSQFNYQDSRYTTLKRSKLIKFLLENIPKEKLLFNSDLQDIKSSSISFFDIINENKDDLSSLENLIDDDNIFSILSKLKLIQQNNENKNFSYSNELYKELLSSSNLDDLYKSAIAVNASYTMINASYEDNTNNYLNDISIFINNINDQFDSYFSIKKELEYLLIITEIDLNKSEYSNSKALDKYNEIFNSSLVSASTKERVKKIHEFQLYK